MLIADTLCSGNGLLSEGDSGLGDHGIEGIKSVITGHVCSPVCSKVPLPSTDILLNLLESKKVQWEDELEVRYRAKNKESTEEEEDESSDSVQVPNPNCEEEIGANIPRDEHVVIQGSSV